MLKAPSALPQEAAQTWLWGLSARRGSSRTTVGQLTPSFQHQPDLNSSAGRSAQELGCQSHSPGIILHPDAIQKLKQRSSPIAWSKVYFLEVSGKWFGVV